MARHRLLRLLPTALGLAAVLTPLAPARADGVVSRVGRSGELVVTGVPGSAPLLSLDAKGQPQGYAMAIIDQVQGELSRALGKPVRVRFISSASTAAASETIASGKADLACGAPFSWDQDQQVDYSLPIGLSGLRLLAPRGRFDGSPAGLSGKRIGAVEGSLALTELKGTQPAAIAVTFPNLSAAVAALKAGRVEGVIGDTLLLAGQANSQGASTMALTPEDPFERYAIACLVPENDSSFRNLVNLAIARLLQGYLDGNPEAVQAINRWVGPDSSLGLPSERIRTYFETVLLGVESIRSSDTPAAGSGS